LGAAVSILGTNTPDDVRGLVRFVQLNEFVCIIDITVYGVMAGDHVIAIHQYGDFTKGWESCGGVWGSEQSNGHRVGQLGIITVDEK
jgi:copper chaperone for superoxide dismutase